MRERAPIRAVLLYASCLLMLSGGVSATEELAKSEDAVCAECHVKPGFKRLTDRGKFFEATRSLRGYAEIEASFGQCTFCHRRRAGSKKLTKVTVEPGDEPRPETDGQRPLPCH